MRFGMREVLFVLVLLAVPMAAFWFVFRPQNEEISQAKAEIVHKEEMLAALAEATEQTESLAQANEEIRQAIELIEARLPTTKEVDVILEQVSDIATGNRLQLLKVKSEKPEKFALYMEQPLKMEIRGSFEGLYSFLLDLEQLDRITRMPHVQVKRDDKEDGMITAKFTLSIYFESEDDPEGRT